MHVGIVLMGMGLSLSLISPMMGDGSGYNIIFGALVFLLGYSFLEYEKYQNTQTLIYTLKR